MAINQISLKPSAVARILGSVAFLLVLASIAGQYSKLELGHDYVKGLVTLFDFDEEQNIPTFFSVLLMFFSTLLLAIIAVLNRKQRNPDASKWAILAIGFLCMAFDEAFEVHEMLNLPVRKLLGAGNLGVFRFSWVIPGIVIVLVIGLLFLRFVLYLPAKVRFRFLTAAALYIGGSIGFELIGGRYYESHGLNNWTYTLIVTVEESLEMAGLIVFIWALLRYCADNYKEVVFRFEA